MSLEAGSFIRFFGLLVFTLVLGVLVTRRSVAAEAPMVGTNAPMFTLKNQSGKDFSLLSRKGAGWTVLYFYPKAETPGCTKQACAFRDSIKKIRALNAEVFGISTDTVEAQGAFHKHHQLQFDLLADPEGTVVSQYSGKILLLGMAKRWTFILDPNLVIRAIKKDVDPALDAQQVADELKV
ncbi:MAG: peroxiredoxin, partial [Proteobacteria bacterium]|nr:peroxiredoxin [Pseudomonadota bacterium]